MFFQTRILRLIYGKLDIFYILLAVIDNIGFLYQLILIIFILIYLGIQWSWFNGIWIGNGHVSDVFGSDFLLRNENLVNELGLPLLLSESSENSPQITAFLHLFGPFALARGLLKGKLGFL